MRFYLYQSGARATVGVVVEMLDARPYAAMILAC